MRRALFTLHKYAGLTVGLLLAVIGLTGSLLVFDHALDERLAPHTVAFEPVAQGAPLSRVLANAQAAVPGQPALQRINLQRGSHSPHVVRFAAPAGAAGPLEVSVSPADGTVLAVRTWGEYPMSWLYRLHYTLLSGDTGKTVVGLMGIALLLFAVSGLVIWWPRKGRWRNALTLRRNGNRFRFYFDLHKVVGVYLAPVLLVVAFSGVSLVFPRQVAALVGSIWPVEAASAVASAVTAFDGQEALPAPLGIDAATDLARQVFPQGKLTRIDLPKSDKGYYRFSFNLPEEPWRTYGASRLKLDQYTGEVLERRALGTLAPGSQFLLWQFPLHNGDVLGLPGRNLLLLTGLAPALLFGSGVYLWWRKRQLRSQKR
ncbi:PepSY domain-containing protein [Aestuariicella hydrocarbonica]|uniref:PepSY domain-containing protein n=1 Tax=Pseudomaricurvus hydrocarbonicus TaxID=1470433 RepID=A0A9E5MKB5_9GAMM|nr:PepSY domain-containing protein [Aestuariicella hydrocarbonica]